MHEFGKDIYVTPEKKTYQPFNIKPEKKKKTVSIFDQDIEKVKKRLVFDNLD